ncbi:Endonuclease III [Buchnera aphidicola (Eriosoma grossulariae)]|uniref:endonuclease III n=1 Tax=Buchnera aphidicola TaxID=9 RepID=UPI0034643F60
MNQIKRNEILNIFHHYQPYPKMELVFNSDFELLVAVILSARSTDLQVNHCTKKLYKIANNPKSILELGLVGLKSYIKNIGLFNKKSSYIINLCDILINRYNSKIPKNRKLLELLPGVGRKTANIILNTVFKKNLIAVDTHVFRVCNRTKFATGKTVHIVENKLNKYVLRSFKLNFHNWIVWHGRYVCQSRKIKCNICIINQLCEFKKKL